MNKHTEGPWVCGEGCDMEWYFAADSEPDVQLGYCLHDKNRPGEAEANAELIANAPDMVHLVRLLCKALTEMTEIDDWPDSVDDDDWNGHSPMMYQKIIMKIGRQPIDMVAFGRALGYMEKNHG